MKLAMISCAAYSDAWPPFFALLEKFWPDHPPVTLLTDTAPAGYEPPHGVTVRMTGNVADKRSWCERLAEYTRQQTEPFLLFQEDFFLNANVKTELIAAAESQLGPLIGGVRIYPCPGGGIPLSGDCRIGIAGHSYRVSCQATIWNPAFLVELLSAIGPGTASDFELKGSRICDKTMLAWMRESKPWPIEYLCTAIQRGEWMPDVKQFCESHGLEVDWTRRPTNSGENRVIRIIT